MTAFIELALIIVGTVGILAFLLMRMLSALSQGSQQQQGKRKRE